MKKFLLVFGFIISFFICFGTLFKLQHWPGASVLMVVGLSLFTMFFIPVLFIQRILDGKSVLNTLVNLFAMISLASIFLGAMFKVQHWPGSGVLLFLGSLLFLFPTMILYIIQQFKEYDRKFGEFYKTVLAIVAVSLFFIFYALNYSRNILVTYLKIEDATIETNSNLASFNQFLIEEIKKGNQKNYSQSAQNIGKYVSVTFSDIERIKTQLIEMSEQSNSEAVINHWRMNSMDNMNVPTFILGNENSSEAQDLRKELLELREKLKRELNQLPFNNKEELIKSLGDFGIKTETDNRMSYKTEDTWQEEMFYNTPMAGTLALLSSLQNQILNAEFVSLSVIYKNRPLK